MRPRYAIGKAVAPWALVDRRLASLDPQERAMYVQALDRETKFKLYFHIVAKAIPAMCLPASNGPLSCPKCPSRNPRPGRVRSGRGSSTYSSATS